MGHSSHPALAPALAPALDLAPHARLAPLFPRSMHLLAAACADSHSGDVAYYPRVVVVFKLSPWGQAGRAECRFGVSTTPLARPHGCGRSALGVFLG